MKELSLSKTKQKKLDASKRKIRETFKSMKILGISPKGEKEGSGKRSSNNTMDQYSRDMERYADRLAADYGIVDITKAKHEHFEKYVKEEVQKYSEGDLSAAHRIKKLRSAVDAFRIGSEKTNHFKEEISCIDVDKVKETLKYHNVTRISEATKTLSIDKETAQKVSEELLNSRSPNKEKIKQAWDLSVQTGTRAMDAISLKAKDVEKTGIWVRDSKGGLTAFVPFMNQNEKEFVHGLVQGKGENTPLIQLTKGDGKLLSKESTATLLDRQVKRAGEKVFGTKESIIHYKFRDEDGVMRWKSTTVEQSIKFHSSRKAFNNIRFDNYITSDNLREQLDERRRDKKVDEKYRAALKRINKKRTSSEREMHDYEIAIFLTSLDARHFRNDVITAWYLDRAKVQKEREAIKAVMNNGE